MKKNAQNNMETILDVQEKKSSMILDFFKSNNMSFDKTLFDALREIDSKSLFEDTVLEYARTRGWNKYESSKEWISFLAKEKGFSIDDLNLVDFSEYFLENAITKDKDLTSYAKFSSFYTFLQSIEMDEENEVIIDIFSLTNGKLPYQSLSTEEAYTLYDKYSDKSEFPWAKFFPKDWSGEFSIKKFHHDEELFNLFLEEAEDAVILDFAKTIFLSTSVSLMNNDRALIHNEPLENLLRVATLKMVKEDSEVEFSRFPKNAMYKLLSYFDFNIYDKIQEEANTSDNKEMDALSLVMLKSYMISVFRYDWDLKDKAQFFPRTDIVTDANNSIWKFLFKRHQRFNIAQRSAFLEKNGKVNNYKMMVWVIQSMMSVVALSGIAVGASTFDAVLTLVLSINFVWLQSRSNTAISFDVFRKKSEFLEATTKGLAYKPDFKPMLSFISSKEIEYKAAEAVEVEVKDKNKE